jgi:hypothetical protein
MLLLIFEFDYYRWAFVLLTRRRFLGDGLKFIVLLEAIGDFGLYILVL